MRTKVINESQHGFEYAWEVVSACEKAGIQCIADQRPQGDILFYDPKGRKYATDKDLMDADVQIWDLFGDNGQKTDIYDEVMLDAIGKDFEKFSVKWNANQKQVGEKDIMATKNCNRIIGNYNETRIAGKRKPSKEFFDKVERIEAQVSENAYLDDFKPIDSAYLDDDDPDFDLDDDGLSNDPDNYEYQDRMEHRRKKAKADGKKVCFRCGDIFDPKDGGGVTKCGDEFCPGCSIDRKDMIVKWFKDHVSENMIDSAVVYWKDKSKSPMVLKNVRGLEDAFEDIRYILSHEPGDIADIDHIKIGSKIYDKDDIDDYLAHEHELEELDYMYRENYEDDPRDWSASEGEIEIVWDTDDLEDFGVFRGDTSTYLIDYDMVSSHEDLIEEVIGMIGEEYPDLDFGRDDFVITNEDEFWEQRGGNPGLWDDDDLSVVDEAISDDGVQFDTITDIPAWATYYIINGEVTDEMNDDDVELVDNYLAELKEKGIYLIEPIDGTYNQFNSSPKFGDACDTNDWTCEVS